MLLTAIGPLEAWRIVDSAFFSLGDEHARLTRGEAVERATARVDSYLDRHARTSARNSGGSPSCMRSRRAGPVARGRGAGGLLFQRRHGDVADIYALDVARGRRRRLTVTPEHEFSPAWSPDRTRIAFARNLGGSEYDVFVMNADGSSIARLTASPGPDERPPGFPTGAWRSEAFATGLDRRTCSIRRGRACRRGASSGGRPRPSGRRTGR